MGPEEAREGFDQELPGYANPRDPVSTAEPVSSDELSEILADIEDIIDCLMSLAPSIRNRTEPKLTLSNSPTSTESNIQLERDAQLVQKVFPTLDSMVADRLLMAISWRRNLLATWKDQSLKTRDPEKSKKM